MLKRACLPSLCNCEINWSGRTDLNGRPLAPQASALPGCATPRLFDLTQDIPEPLLDLFDDFGRRRPGTKGLYLLRRLTRSESLPDAFYCKPVFIEKSLYLEDHVEVLSRINPLPRLVLSRTQKGKLRLPVSQDVRLDARDPAYLPDLVKELVGERSLRLCYTPGR